MAGGNLLTGRSPACYVFWLKLNQYKCVYWHIFNSLIHPTINEKSFINASTTMANNYNNKLAMINCLSPHRDFFFQRSRTEVTNSITKNVPHPSSNKWHEEMDRHQFLGGQQVSVSSSVWLECGMWSPAPPPVPESKGHILAQNMFLHFESWCHSEVSTWHFENVINLNYPGVFWIRLKIVVMLWLAYEFMGPNIEAKYPYICGSPGPLTAWRADMVDLVDGDNHFEDTWMDKQHYGSATEQPH